MRTISSKLAPGYSPDQKLIILLNHIGWSRSELARKTRVSDAMIYNMANGTRDVPPVLLSWLYEVAVYMDEHPPPRVRKTRNRKLEAMETSK